MNEYEIDVSMSDREEDHLIPLQFGGKLISTETHASSNTKESRGQKLEPSSEHDYP